MEKANNNKKITVLEVLKQNKIGKKYLIESRNPIQGTEKSLVENGELLLRSEDTHCLPAEFEVVDKEKKLLSVTLYEGRYHQVRRMMAALGLGVPVSITRTQIGNFTIDGLPEGQWRHLTNEEVKNLYDSVGLNVILKNTMMLREASLGKKKNTSAKVKKYMQDTLDTLKQQQQK